jgi:phosphatidylglycerol:prolipoprotein diacylglycerol transferase
MRFYSTGFSILGLSVRWYGLLIALGIGLGVLLALRRERQFGLPKDTVIDLALCGVPAAIVGARLYYVIFSWADYAADPLSALRVWEGGLAIYGGILGGLLAGLIYARVKGLRFLTLADLVAPSFALGQAVGRWGNFVNQEAYGAVATQAWQQRFPISVFIQADGQWHFATFFYESAWCFIIVAALLIAERRHRFRRDGEIFRAYVFLYAIERALVEGLRTDSLRLGSFRVSQLLSLAALLTCAAIALAQAKRKTAPAITLALCIAMAALLLSAHPWPALICAVGAAGMYRGNSDLSSCAR